MKKITKIIIVIVALALSSIYFLRTSNKPLCGTPFVIRNSTGQCEVYVGCSLPAGITEDSDCKLILKQQIDENLSKIP